MSWGSISVNAQQGVKVLDINEEYCVEILGLGEIYEIASVERLRKRLRKKYGGGILFLASNKDHSGRGLTLEELVEYVKSHGLKVIEAGYVDSPPWPSRKKEVPRNVVEHAIILSLARRIFDVLSNFERLTSSRRRAHMVYCFSTSYRRRTHKKFVEEDRGRCLSYNSSRWRFHAEKLMSSTLLRAQARPQRLGRRAVELYLLSAGHDFELLM